MMLSSVIHQEKKTKTGLSPVYKVSGRTDGPPISHIHARMREYATMISYLCQEIVPAGLVHLVGDFLEQVVAEGVDHHLGEVRLGLAADLGHERRVALVELQLQQPAADLWHPPPQKTKRQQ